MPKFYDELGEASLENLASDPSNLPEGRVWKNSTSQLPKVAIGGAVKELITNDATQTLSNKTISGASNTITNVSGSNVVNTPSGNLAATDVQAALNELQSDIDTRATSSALTTHTSATTSVHGITDTADLLTTSNAKVVTNKDIDGGTASNTNRVTIPKDTLANLQALTRKEGTIVYATDTDKFYSDNGTTLVPVGSGSGAKNYFTDGDSEGANPFTLFNDGSAIWVDGTGGSPTATITQSATTPLSGQKSFLFTSGAQYDTAKASITIDREDKYKVVTLEAAYEKVSGTYADGDLQILLYDSTNGSILYPTPVHNLQASGINAKQQFAFQATDSLTYQILIHQKTSATFVMKFEMKIGPQLQAGYAPITTDDEEITPVFAQLGTVSAISVYKSQVGKDLFLRGNFTTGTIGTGSPYIEMPNGLLIDDTKYPSGVISIVGKVVRGVAAASGGTYVLNLVYNGSDNTKLYFSTSNGGDSPTTVIANATTQFNSSEVQLLDTARIKIKGWSSESKVISEYDGRLVAARAYYAGGVGGVAVTAANPFPLDTIDYDKQGNLTVGSGFNFTAKQNGVYSYSFEAVTSLANASLEMYKNGSFYRTLTFANSYGYMSVSGEVDLLTNDYIDFRSQSGLTIYGTGHSVPSATAASFYLLSGAQQILAGQKILARLSGDPASVSAGNIIIFPTKDFDTTGAYNTSSGQYTVHANGYLDVYGFAQSAATGVQIQVYKNASADILLGQTDSNGECSFMGTLPVLAGDLIDIRPTGGTLDLQTGSLLYFKLY